MMFSAMPSLARVGILGGTFDPVHNGHLAIARAFRKRFRLDRVLLIPTYRPPHKSRPDITPARHRYRMLQLAVPARDRRWLVPSDIEIRRRTVSYTLHTLKRLRRKYGPRTELFFLIGGDMLPELHTWHRIQEVLARCTLVIAPRAKGALKPLIRKTARRLKIDPKRQLLPLSMRRVSTSSTEIRHSLREGKQIDLQIPAAVAAYTRRHALYNHHGQTTLKTLLDCPVKGWFKPADRTATTDDIKIPDLG